MHFQEFWDFCAQNKTSEISKHGLSGILGLLCAEQDGGSLNKCTFRKSGPPVRRTKRRQFKNKTETYTLRSSGTPVRKAKRRKFGFETDVDADDSIAMGFDLMVSLVSFWITLRLLWRCQCWFHFGWTSYWNHVGLYLI